MNFFLLLLMEDYNKNNESLNINDSSDLILKRVKENLQKRLLIISIISIFIAIIIIILIVIAINSPDKRNNKKVKGEINCKYFININKNSTLILGKEFEKKSDFSMVVDGKKLDKYTKEYSFDKYGEHQIKFQLYEDLNMDFMFKDIKSLESVEMISNYDLKLQSMVSSFENCNLFNKFLY